MKIEQFWQALRTFWTPERLDKWWQAIYEDGHGGPEKLQNLLCLDPNTHMLHGLGWFGLEPLNAALDGSWMNVQFWWLRPGERDASVEFTTLRSFLRFLILRCIGFVFMMLGVVALCAREMLLRWLRRIRRLIRLLICGLWR